MPLTDHSINYIEEMPLSDRKFDDFQPIDTIEIEKTQEEFEPANTTNLIDCTDPQNDDLNDTFRVPAIPPIPINIKPVRRSTRRRMTVDDDRAELLHHPPPPTTRQSARISMRRQTVDEPIPDKKSPTKAIKGNNSKSSKAPRITKTGMLCFFIIIFYYIFLLYNQECAWI